jgi:hypothetical protein
MLHCPFSAVLVQETATHHITTRRLLAVSTDMVRRLNLLALASSFEHSSTIGV